MIESRRRFLGEVREPPSSIHPRPSTTGMADILRGFLGASNHPHFSKQGNPCLTQSLTILCISYALHLGPCIRLRLHAVGRAFALRLDAPMTSAGRRRPPAIAPRVRLRCSFVHCLPLSGETDRQSLARPPGRPFDNDFVAPVRQTAQLHWSPDQEQFANSHKYSVYLPYEDPMGLGKVERGSLHPGAGNMADQEGRTRST